jgi:hypothetical protein
MPKQHPDDRPFYRTPQHRKISSFIRPIYVTKDLTTLDPPCAVCGQASGRGRYDWGLKAWLCAPCGKQLTLAVGDVVVTHAEQVESATTPDGRR